MRAPEFILYWDIDGTLLTTARAGVPALEDGFEAVLGIRPDLTTFTTSGFTDPEIVDAVLRRLDTAEPDLGTIQEILAEYSRALPDRLKEKRGSVLPGVRETLEEFAQNPRVQNMLLTGNVSAGAWAKLTAYGLANFFEIGGFGDDAPSRPEIADIAVRRAIGRYGRASLSGILIGDTPSDIHAGRSVGLRVLAVASGTFSVDHLAEHRPWWCAEHLPPAAEILDQMSRLEISDRDLPYQRAVT